MNRFAIDTNILVYNLFEDDFDKRIISEKILIKSSIICSQVLSEFLNVSQRKFKLDKISIFNLCMQTIGFCTLYPVSKLTLKKAETIIKNYQLQIFDAIIVASAIESNCSILYSEDLQHHQVSKNYLTIVNPFL